jgi:hypothetical protein
VPALAEAARIDSLRHHIAIAPVANRVEIEKCFPLITKTGLTSWATMATLAASVAISIVMLHSRLSLRESSVAAIARWQIDRGTFFHLAVEATDRTIATFAERKAAIYVCFATNCT